MRTLSQEFKHGLNAEARVTQYFKSAGYEVLRSSKRDNIEFDIDLIISNKYSEMSVSVKRQDDGLKYGHVYFELWEGMEPNKIKGGGWNGKRLTFVGDRWILVLKRPSWLDTGRADLYAIVQGDELILIYKDTVTALVRNALDSGRARVLELSHLKRVRAMEQGHPAITNECIYLDRETFKRHALEVIDLSNGVNAA